MELKALTTKQEMLQCFDILKEVYPNMTLEEYDRELETMIPNNYTQLIAIDGDTIAGLTGIWLGSKLWCGKYMELDNVVVSQDYRSKGVGELIFNHCEAKAKELGCTMIALDSYTDNFKAHKFFYKQHFVPRGFHFINIIDPTKVR